MGDFPKADMTLDELVQMMAGGAELEALSHELAREMPDSEVAKTLGAEVAETLHTRSGHPSAETRTAEPGTDPGTATGEGPRDEGTGP